jgi:hypothetical protein
MAKLKAPKNSGGLSFNGVNYAVKRGSIEIPDEAVEAALSHGFTIIGAEAQAAEDAANPPEGDGSAPADGTVPPAQ